MSTSLAAAMTVAADREMEILPVGKSAERQAANRYLQGREQVPVVKDKAGPAVG
jgi:hypothetical protein